MHHSNMNQDHVQRGVTLPWQELVRDFQEVFQPPKSLPPERPFDHRIILKEGTTPISQRPYRHPAVQKDIIKKTTRELLEAGVRNSQSSFAAPIVLVKKKDGQWRLCMDYRRLNDSTVKDKFPIPLIEELLDELGGATWLYQLIRTYPIPGSEVQDMSYEFGVEKLELNKLELLDTKSLTLFATLSDQPNYRVIKALHGDDGKIGKKVKSSYPSIWLDIIHEVSLFKMYALESHKKIDVASKLSHTGLEFSFRRAPRGGAEKSQFELLKEKVEGCSLVDMKDRWV
ncbi:hypothetical protein Tco_1244964 [Tanacetum coccineum]